jgi:hypothetical protein
MNKFRCFVDEHEGVEYCVFDDDCTDNCDVAYDLSRSGFCKTDCKYWKSNESVLHEVERLIQHEKTRTLLSNEAKQRLNNINLSQISLDIDMINTSPVFESSGFGVGVFVKK